MTDPTSDAETTNTEAAQDAADNAEAEAAGEDSGDDSQTVSGNFTDAANFNADAE